MLCSEAPEDPVGAAVEGFESTGTVSNKQANDILISAKAVQQLVQQTGVKLDGLTKAQQRNAVKDAVKQMAEQNAAQTNVEEQNKIDDKENESRRLTDSDMQDYMLTGDRLHVRDKKQQIVDNGESPILTKPEEIVAFIRDAFYRKIQKVVKGYGKVNNRLANSVKTASNGQINIDDYYLELDADKIAHISDHVVQDKDTRNIPLTEEQLEQLPEYIDTYDDLIDIIKRKDGSVRLMLGKKINGHSIIVETVSKGRKSLHPVTAYQIDSADYERYYKTRAIDRSSTSRPANADTVDISRQAIAPSTIISNDGQSVNTENGAVGAAEKGFSPKYDMIDKYGAIPEGENPTRVDQLPKSTDGNDRVSRTARTAFEAKVTTDAFAQLIEKETVKGGFSYIPIKNSDTVQEAKKVIQKKGWEDAKIDWMADVRAGKSSPQLAAIGALLYNNAVNSAVTKEEYRNALDILVDYSLLERNAAGLGFKTVILDDGWQFPGPSSGDYALCGEWEVSEDKFADFKAFTQSVHKLGMKLVVWFAVPFVGINSPLFERFRDKLLYVEYGNMNTGALDPRYPEVRTYIKENYKRFLCPISEAELHPYQLGK